jgi:toxin YoeB
MAFELIFSEQVNEELTFFRKSGNVQILKKIKLLFIELSQHPLEGTGKPEPLKHHLTGYWSRRITGEHRLVYEVIQEEVHIYSVKGHYT